MKLFHIIVFTHTLLVTQSIGMSYLRPLMATSYMLKVLVAKSGSLTIMKRHSAGLALYGLSSGSVSSCKG